MKANSNIFVCHDYSSEAHAFFEKEIFEKASKLKRKHSDYSTKILKCSNMHATRSIISFSSSD